MRLLVRVKIKLLLFMKQYFSEGTRYKWLGKKIPLRKFGENFNREANKKNL